MISYRISIDAYINFTVQAVDEDEALNEAQKIVRKYGYGLAAGSTELDMRVYPDINGRLEITGISEIK